MRKVHHGWIIVAFGVLMQIFSLGIFMYSFGIVLLPWTASFSASRAELTAIPVAMQLASVAAGPVIGHFLDRIPTRVAVLAGTLTIVLTLFLLSRAANVVELITISAVPAAISTTLAGPQMAQTMTVKWFRMKLGMPLAISALGSSAGGFLMPPTMQWLIDLYGWRAAYEHLAFAAAVILGPILIWVFRLPEPSVEDSSSEQARPTSPAISRDKDRFTMTRILRDKVFLMVTISLAVVGALQLVFQYYLPVIGHDNDIPPKESALLLSMLAGAAIAGKLFWGMVIDRVGAQVIYAILSLLYVIAVALILGLAGPVGYLHLLVCAGVAGFAVGAVVPLLSLVMAQRFGAGNIGKALGLAMPFLNLSVLGPVIASYGYEETGSYAVGMASLLGAIIICAFVLFRGLGTAKPSGSEPAVS